MTEIQRALIVILILATVFFAFSQRIAGLISDPNDLARRRNIGLILTLVVFLSANFWIYSLAVVVTITYTSRRESNPAALYLFLLLVIPVGFIPLPGIGSINYFFNFSNARLLALIVLFPAYISLRKKSDTVPFGRTWADKMFAAYLLLTVVLNMREDNLTDNMRVDFCLVLDIFLPYYVFSRSLKNMQSFRDAILSVELVIMVIALLSVFEASKSWLLYSEVSKALALTPDSGYLGRDGILRAIVTTGQAISLGYLMAIGVGLYLFIQRFIVSKFIRRAGFALIAAGLIAPLSRGPWLGVVVLTVIYFLMGPKSMRNLIRLALGAVLALSLVSALPGGERIINLLPFIGTTESGNLTYRQQLFTNATIVIQRNPWFGSIDYMKTPEMEEMRQGEGIIDIVNSYIQVALDAGLVGLSLFVGFFALIVSGIYRAMRSIHDKNSDEYLLGRVLLSTQLAILFMIFTVSSNFVVSIIYWPVAGLGMGYMLMVRKNVVQKQKGLASHESTYS
jgi:O-antigen ligase